MRGVAEANWSMRFLVSLGTGSAISEVGTRLLCSARNDKRVFKNVVAQFIGQMRLMNQATTEIWR